MNEIRDLSVIVKSFGDKQTLSDSEIIEDICAASKKYVVKSKDNGKKS